MSDYGADTNPDQNLAAVIGYGYNLASIQRLQFDQFSIDANNRVLKYCDGTGLVNLKIKFDPAYSGS